MDHRLYEKQIELERKQQLYRYIPQIIAYKTILYIRAHPGGIFFLDDLESLGYNITIVEAFEKNVEWLNSLNKYKIIFADIRKYEFDFYKKYDVIMWYSGIEHINEKEIPDVLEKFEKYCNNLIILSCPFGQYRQNAAGGNIYQNHLSTIYPSFFKQFKEWNVITSGVMDKPVNNILAWKVL